MKQKVIFIAGLARSGTTFLGLKLSRNSKAVCLGEVSQTIEGILATEHKVAASRWLDVKSRTCSCGKPVDLCEFWGEVKQNSQGDVQSPQELHRVIADRFREKFGDKVLIDTSKDIRALNHYQSEYYDLNVVYISRDYRGWVPSIKKHLKNNNITDLGYIYHAYRWWFATTRHIKFLKGSRIKTKFLSYEKIVFDYEQQFSELNSFLGLKTEDYSNERVAHDVYGSVFKNKKGMDEQLKYDYKWMYSVKSWAYSFFVIPVVMLNSKIYKEL